MKPTPTKLHLLLISLLTLLTSSCSSDNPSPDLIQETESKRIGVICPGSWRGQWEKIAAWACENLMKAQEAGRKRIRLEIEWIDEARPDLASHCGRLATEESCALLIGPRASTEVAKVALEVEGRIPMIVPTASSTELQRVFGGHNGLWFLTQSDISQCEVLLTQAALADCSKVALIAADDTYGKSFTDWFAYQATELGLSVDKVITYTSPEELKKAVRSFQGAPGWYEEALILAPSSPSDMKVVDAEIGRLKSEASPYLQYPALLCSDMADSPELLGGLKNYRYEGVSPSADPRSGWTAAAEVVCGKTPFNGSAHFYDSLLMALFALYAQQEGEALNNSILRLVDSRGEICDGWTATDLRKTFQSIDAGLSPDLRGVTGDWTWDEKNHNSVVGSVYSHWIYDGGDYRVLEYLSLNPKDGSISSLQSWDHATKQIQKFDENQHDLKYPDLNDRYAVVVGASDTWINYRHQADALAMYQMLRKAGYDDHHIILILEDNIAGNPYNLYPGVVKVTPDGENLYAGAKIDYNLSALSKNDLYDILSGNRSERLPEVISPGANDNVIFFWCGHGSGNTLMWGSRSYVYGSDMERLISRLHQEGRYRKMMFVLDACYSGTIGEACEGVPGLLVFTAANALEPSKADVYDNDLHVWLSNGFTRTFRDVVGRKPDVSMRDLYYETVRGTTGSHPHIYDAEQYGNMLRESIHEFL